MNSVKKLHKEDHTYNRLNAAHKDIERKIDELDKHLFLTTEEQTEITKLKKLKLQHKDKMQRLLKTYGTLNKNNGPSRT